MTIDELRRVLIVGTGEMGRQIAASCFRTGYAVTLYDASEDSLRAALTACEAVAESDNDRQRLRVTSDPAAAGYDADLLIESVPERLALKRGVFSTFAEICPPHTIFTTNTSLLMPSMFIGASKRPERLAALHFVMGSTLTEIMPHNRTAPETVQILEQFSARIGHTSVVCRREQPGHLVNTMLMALNTSALTLAANGVAEPEDIDRAWMLSTHSVIGPFGLLDLVGLKTALEITEYGARMTAQAQVSKNADYLRAMVEQGRLGRPNGHGFYDYPDPAFEQPEFLAPASPPPAEPHSHHAPPAGTRQRMSPEGAQS